jgi:hypothetical protein
MSEQAIHTHRPGDTARLLNQAVHRQHDVMCADLTMIPLETANGFGLSEDDLDAIMHGTLRRITTAAPEQVTTAVSRGEST